jgi:hypothetical protein
MIISHKYKFIFLKTNKTAGTSIEIALSGACGADDIISPVSPADEKTRLDLGYRGPQHYLASAREYGIGDVLKLVVTGRKKKRFYAHMPARKIKPLVAEQVWSDYYKFCFERNPWDRVISLYYWRCKSEPRPSITSFIDSGELQRLKQKGRDLYTIDGQIAVDEVCRFEDIPAELESIRARLGITEKLELHQAKSNFRIDKRSYREILDTQQQARIADIFNEEISLMGYEF